MVELFIFVFQEQHFVNLTSKIRAIRPDADVKIPTYWAVMLDNALFCYEAANYLRANPNLWLKDDLGHPVYSNKWSGVESRQSGGIYFQKYEIKCHAILHFLSGGFKLLTSFLSGIIPHNTSVIKSVLEI